jgi:hypothetical protein
MSTLKTVFLTTAVLLVGAVLFAGYQIAIYQQDRIDALQSQLSEVQLQVAFVQKQTAKADARLNRTIKTTNKNFATVSDQQDVLRKAILTIIEVMKDGDSAPAPTNYTQSRNGL